MIDIHTHILFGVDDGCETLEESMELLGDACNEGITDIICTPHALHPQYNVTIEQVTNKLALLSENIEKKGLSIRLHPGQEIRLCEDLVEKVLNREVLTLANSKYLLLELPSHTIPSYIINIIQSLVSIDIVPIIAHPERNRAIAENPQRLEKLIRHGAISQITAGSVAGHFGKNIQKLSLKLISTNLVHTYGSDAHNSSTRPLLFDKGLAILEKKKMFDHIDVILENNERIIKNEPLFMLEPEVIGAKKLFGIW
ncbi:capsular biosynthesis protein [Sporosarcina saromensis]|uniref:Tyrosine-protein phosphatase n=1 Tax=Sporosarcina saromensis TaxID=359365 RepID=A0ABU4G7N7_9BACL|nr:CpsB/CapC family capsule biosynthesis tyrosine phosphatase [Sporosarcina saromensis]MDW0112994.1 capsular biosynthesis protein [Sporosarcina saromensis]